MNYWLVRGHELKDRVIDLCDSERVEKTGLMSTLVQAQVKSEKINNQIRGVLH